VTTTRDRETGRQGDKETGSKECGFLSPCLLVSLSPCLLVLFQGCAWDGFTLFKPPTPPPPPVESFVLRPDGLSAEKKPAEGGPQAALAGAHELYRQEQYAKAERLYHSIAENKKNPTPIAQEARFFEAECLRKQDELPRAADTYQRLLNDFHSNPWLEQANQRIYDIAMFWLVDTWAEMNEAEEKRQGKRWFVNPRFISFEKKKPLLDREGRALEKLQQVAYNDLRGPLADKCLFICGRVNLFRENYREADEYFSKVAETYKNSPYAAEAMEKAIFCKQMATGGSDYDGRKCAEARKMVDAALRMPGLDEAKKQKIAGQLASITAQQAEKDFKVAEFYRHTNHPGPAYFCYEIVRRRYPNSDYARLAGERQAELRGELEKKHGGDERREIPDSGSETAGPSQRFQGAKEMSPIPRGLPLGSNLGTQ
jgi:outer membrane protein assembly factor BamD (BamD/ComL family)